MDDEITEFSGRIQKIIKIEYLPTEEGLTIATTIDLSPTTGAGRLTFYNVALLKSY